MISEAEGKQRLLRVFREHGFHVEQDVRFDGDGISVTWDGWDAQARVGFEYITAEANDAQEFTPEVIARIESLIRDGKLSVLLIDELDIDDVSDLEDAARAFLDHVKKGVGR